MQTLTHSMVMFLIFCVATLPALGITKEEAARPHHEMAKKLNAEADQLEQNQMRTPRQAAEAKVLREAAKHHELRAEVALAPPTERKTLSERANEQKTKSERAWAEFHETYPRQPVKGPMIPSQPRSITY